VAQLLHCRGEIWGTHSHVANCSSLLGRYSASTFGHQRIAFISKVYKSEHGLAGLLAPPSKWRHYDPSQQRQIYQSTRCNIPEDLYIKKKQTNNKNTAFPLRKLTSDDGTRYSCLAQVYSTPNHHAHCRLNNSCFSLSVINYRRGLLSFLNLNHIFFKLLYTGMKCVSPADNLQAVTSDLSNLYVVLFLSYVTWHRCMFSFCIIRLYTYGNTSFYVLLVKWHRAKLCTLLHSSSGITAQVLT